MSRSGSSTDQGQSSIVPVSPIEVSVLGPLGLRKDGIDIAVGGLKQRSVLAMLTVSPGRPVSLDQIVDAIYGEDGGDARNSVYTYISALRRELGDVVRKQGGGYVLDLEPSSVDARRFESEVQSALTIIADQPEAAAGSLRRALEMWRGHAYSDVDGHGWFQPEVTRLSELRLGAIEARIDADLALGRHRELLGELDALTIEHPLRERFRGQQMLALYRAGRQTEALRAYEQTRSYLAEEVGIDPSPALRRLEQQILDQDRSLDLPLAPSLTFRAVMAVDIASPEVLAHLDPSERADLAKLVAQQFEQLVDDHGGSGFGQRGSALYAAFTDMRDAIDVAHGLRASRLPIRVRTAVDYGEVEVHDTGEIDGPPLRRSAGLVAVAHPGQMLLSVGAHQALVSQDDRGWVVRSLGSHLISGTDKHQQVFQLVFAGEEDAFPPLMVDTPPAPLPGDRGAVAGYELRQPIFSDLSGTTYRAYEPLMGREVVITAIDSIWANRAGFVSRFEVETHLVTRLQHPHIVPIYDYWRDPTGAYLVSPPVGEALARTLERGLLDSGQRHRLIRNIGEALMAAHRFGIVHGSLSPSTVAVDAEGNGYLTGIGFVMRLPDAPRVASPFTAPERAETDSPTIAGDVFSLGALMRVLLTGTDDTIAADLEAVVDRATATAPEVRFTTIDELLHSFDNVLGISEATVSLTHLRNPYKGLEAFNETDAADFYGRTGAVTDLLARIAERPLVAVVGPSGCGKSSLVAAGLIPAVRAGGDSWVTTTMFPGTYPFVELETALARVAVEDIRSLGALDDDEYALVQVSKQILPSGTSLLLVIDQFEELFTLTRDSQTRDRFLSSLVSLAADQRSNVRVVITLRADFFDRPLQDPRFGELLEIGTFPLATPGPIDLAEAIRTPAESVGVAWEPGLVEQIVEDVADAPGTLPLVQFAMTEVFAARETDVLTLDGYQRAGGVLGALGAHADQVYTRLDESRQEITRQLFLRLVAIQPSGEQTRRRVRLTILSDLGDQADVAAVLEAFGHARLLTFDRDPIARSPTVEVAHEALLTRWPRLAQWISEAKEDLLLHQRLSDAVAEWEQSGKDDSYLLSRGRLAQFGSWSEATDLTMSRLEAEYLDLSSERSHQEQTRRRRIRNLVTSGFALAAVVASILGAMALISRQEATDNAALAHARELVASAFDVLDEDPELSLLLAVQAAGSSTQTIGSLTAIHESLGAHRKILTYTWPSDQTLAIDLSAVISPDGRLLVASSGGTYVEVVEVDSGERLWGHDFGGHGITRATFTRDGEQVAVTYGWTDAADGRPPDEDTRAALGVHVLDSRTGEPVRYLPIGERCGVVTRVRALSTVQNESGSFLTAELGNDSNCNFTGDTRGGTNPRDRAAPPPSLIDLDTGETTRMHDLRFSPGAEPAAKVSSDGRFVARQSFNPAGDGGVTHVIEWNTGLQIAELDGWLLGISADGSTVLTMEAYEEVWVWDLSQGQPAGPASTLSGDFNGPELWLSPSGDIVGKVVDTGIQLWDAETGAEIESLATGLGSNGQVASSDDESRILITEAGGRQAVLFDRTAAEEIGATDLCHPTLDSVTPMNSAGGVIAVNADCGTAHLLFLITAASPKEAEQFASSGVRSALSGDGSRLYYQTIDETGFTGSVQPLDTALGEVGDPLPGLCEHLGGSGNGCLEFPNPPFRGWAYDLEISPDGSMLAMTGEYNDGVTIWDLTRNRILATPRVTHLTRQPDRSLSVAFSPDGSRLAVSFGWGSPELWLLSTQDWEPIAHFGSGAQAPTVDLVFTDDGGTLIGTDDVEAGVGRIVFMDGQTLDVVDEIRDAHDAAITGLALSGDGSLLASSGLDGFVRVWDVASRNLVHEIPAARGAGGVGGVVFVTDQRLAVTDNSSGTLRMFTIDTAELLDLARSRVTRAFTTTECATYRIDPCPTLEDIRSG